MFYNYFDDYQYDSCISKGICSIGPKTSSLREVLIMYLKLLAFYVSELKSFGGHNKDAQIVILNTISLLMSNMETADKQLIEALLSIKTLIIESKSIYIDICTKRNIEPKNIITDIELNDELDVKKLVQLGEKEFAKRSKDITSERKNLFEIMAFVIKSLCINIVEIKEYDKENICIENGFLEILTLLNVLNFPEINNKEILECINNAVDCDYEISEQLKQIQIEKFGEPQQYEISLSTRPNKAILVAGTSLIELEKLLEYTKDKNIDVYTHGEMIIAHTYPKFQEYQHLIGHFGIGIENCLLDFANFPGAILITKYAIENIEYLYRGRLFTTDFFVPKGAIKVENDDFSKVVESAKNAKGFKHGKQKGSITVGISKENIEAKRKYFLENKDNYKKIIIIAPESHTKKNKTYFSNLIENIPDNVFVISFAHQKDAKNIVNFNDVTDFSLIYKIIKDIDNKKNITIFISKCDKHTIPNMIKLTRFGINNIFLSKCAPILLNPTLTNILSRLYGVKSSTQAIEDLNYLLNNN